VREKRASLATSRALAAQTAGHTDQARAELRSALELLPEDANARKQLAALELAQGNAEVAFLEFQALTELSPEDPDGWIALARLMRTAGLLEAPEAYAGPGARERRPVPGGPSASAGRIRERLGRYQGALEDARAAHEGRSRRRRGPESPDPGPRAGWNAPPPPAGALGPPPAPPRRLRPDAQVDRSALGAWTASTGRAEWREMRKSFEQQTQRP
jgi:tetratricopeptide (TPR) repeat protein